uniref:Putative secreted protein n=1 Tax=Anopheles darlingi TaxID=43151 RepID=A0A2M4DCK1_ANODA
MLSTTASCTVSASSLISCSIAVAASDMNEFRCLLPSCTCSSSVSSSNTIKSSPVALTSIFDGTIWMLAKVETELTLFSLFQLTCYGTWFGCWCCK